MGYGETIFGPSKNDDGRSIRSINLQIVVSFLREADFVATVSISSVDVELARILTFLRDLHFQFCCCGKTIFRLSKNDNGPSIRRINL